MPKTTDDIVRRTYLGEGDAGAVRLASIDKEKHEVEFVIATDAPVQDSFYGPPTALSMKGAILKEFRKNPVVLAQHENAVLGVVGRSLKEWVEGDRLISRAAFDVGDEWSARVWGKIERGFLRGASIGYRVVRTRNVEEGQTDKATGLVGPVRIGLQWRLLEWSVVAVGADSESLGRGLGAVDGPGADRGALILAPLAKAPFKLPLL
jgi:hypothetical protein